MSLVVFDIGGSAVKYGLWDKQTLSQTSQFSTPATFEEMQSQLQTVVQSFGEQVTGVAISSPGAVNVAARRIDGISAVPYIHHRPIFDELEAAFGLPVTIENDANCAGICEVALGAGRGKQAAIFVVIGSGVGGAIFINGRIYKGAHLFGGEFGLMQNTNRRTLSNNGTAVNVAKAFSEQTGTTVTGKELFERKDAGNPQAAEALETMYQHLAEALYNLQVSIDPEIIMVGGGISARPELITALQEKLQHLLSAYGVPEIMPEIKACHFQNDANLIGAAVNFENLNN